MRKERSCERAPLQAHAMQCGDRHNTSVQITVQYCGILVLWSLPLALICKTVEDFAISSSCGDSSLVELTDKSKMDLGSKVRLRQN